MEAGTRSGNTIIAFIVIGIVCFFNTIPLAFISLVANLSALTLYVPALNNWKNAGQWGDWTFSLVSGVLPSIISGLFSFLLPVMLRRLTKYAGKTTRSGLDRNVIARYFFFLVFSYFIIFSLIGVFYRELAARNSARGDPDIDLLSRLSQRLLRRLCFELGDTKVSLPSCHLSAVRVRFCNPKSCLIGLTELYFPADIGDSILSTYVGQSTYWLTVFPLRNFLIVFEIAQVLKLVMLSVQKV